QPLGAGFADRATVESSTGPPRQGGDQRALPAPLGIDHQIVAVRPQLTQPLTRTTTPEKMQLPLPPLTMAARNHPVHHRMPGRNLGEGRIGRPIETQLRV